MPVIPELIAKAVCADDGSRMNNDIVSHDHIIVNNCIGINPTVFAYLTFLPM